MEILELVGIRTQGLYYCSVGISLCKMLLYIARHSINILCYAFLIYGSHNNTSFPTNKNVACLVNVNPPGRNVATPWRVVNAYSPGRKPGNRRDNSASIFNDWSVFAVSATYTFFQ